MNVQSSSTGVDVGGVTTRGLRLNIEVGGGWELIHFGRGGTGGIRAVMLSSLTSLLAKVAGQSFCVIISELTPRYHCARYFFIVCRLNDVEVALVVMGVLIFTGNCSGRASCGTSRSCGTTFAHDPSFVG